MSTNAPDIEPVETREWLDSVDAVVEVDGRDRMSFLLDRVVDRAQDLGVHTTAGLQTPYVNTIPPEDEPEMPGDQELERLATALVRWNAIAIVLQANAAATSRATSPRRRSTRSASTISGAPARRTISATSSSSRVTRRRGSTRARSSKDGSPRTSCTAFGRRWGAVGSRPTRTRG